MFGWTADEAAGHPVYELISTSLSDEELAAEMTSLVQAGRWRGEATWHGKGGRPVYAEAKNVALRCGQSSVTGYLCIFRDLSERQQARKELEMRARQQALLAELTVRNLANGELQALLNDAVALVAHTPEVELCAVVETLPGGREMSWRAVFGWTEQAPSHPAPRSASAGSLVGYAFTAGDPVISEDVRADERFRISPVFAAQKPTSAVAVGIPVERERFGVFVSASREHRSFTSEDVDFIRAVANIIGMAVERSRVVRRLEEVRESERRRIARDLHDDALTELAGAVSQASQARSAAGSDADQERWRSQLVTLRRVGQQLRGSIYDFRLGAAEHRPFPDLLSELVAHHAERSVDADVRLQGPERLPGWELGRRGTEVLHIVGEAITNARRHSGAGTITIDAGESDPAALRLRVSDDGTWRARTAPGVSGHGAGIAGMLERAELLGADLRIERRSEGGTAVVLELPLGNRRQPAP
jgi:PAS domain S-box-containing protein